MRFWTVDLSNYEFSNYGTYTSESPWRLYHIEHGDISQDKSESGYSLLVF